MRRSTIWLTSALVATLTVAAAAQGPTPAVGFDKAAADVQARLEASLAALAELEQRLTAEKLPLSQQLETLDLELTEVKAEFQRQALAVDRRGLDVNNLTNEIKKRRDEIAYVSTAATEYGRRFESRLHIAELQRYRALLEAATLAAENPSLSDHEVFAAQSALMTQAIERLHDAIGGAIFPGTAVDADGLVSDGAFALVGPTALFRSSDGKIVGSAEQRLNSHEPAAIALPRPELTAAAATLVETGAGTLPLDPTLGDALKVAATEETLWQEVQKGGPVMIPIFVMAAAALLVALIKWLGMMFLRKPSPKKINGLLQAVSQRDQDAARVKVRAIKGPVGRMLAAGVENLKESRDLIEEVMYERLLTSRLRLQRLLPFIAICAASAPLLGLLGTVTGIISTFQLMTVYGSGDVKNLSGGISEALITTKYGLIVAIPSLLLHAYLSRRARGVVGDMETAAVAFVNQVSKTPLLRPSVPRDEPPPLGCVPDPDEVRVHVNQILSEMLGPLTDDSRSATA